MSLLSGYLPGDNGLERMIPSLIAAFEAEYKAGAHDAPQVVVVGILDVTAVKHKLGGDPIPDLKWTTLEAVTGARADQVRFIAAHLRSEREGSESLTGVDDAIERMLADDGTVPGEHTIVGDGAGNPVQPLRPGVVPEWSDPDNNDDPKEP